MTTSCPACGQPLPVDPQRCPACGIVLAGPVAAELWRVDVALGQLRRRRQELLDALRAQTAPAVPAMAPAPGPTVDGVEPRSIQRVLLGLGVLLLVVAGLVFVAVAWRTLGVSGQVAVVAAAAVLACAASRVLERFRLLASAEAVAALGVGLVGVGLVSARTLGLGVATRVDGLTYAAVSAGLLALACAGAGLRSARLTWGTCLVLAVGAAVLLGLLAGSAGWLAASVTLGLSAAGLAALHAVPPRWLRLRWPSLVAAVGFAVATWLVTPAAAWTAASPWAPGCALVGLVVSAGVVVVDTRRGRTPVFRPGRRALATLALIAAGVQLAAGVAVEPLVARTALVVLAGAALGFAAWWHPDWRTHRAGAIAAVSTVSAVLAAADLLVDLRTRDRPGWGELAPLVVDGTWVAVLVTALVGAATSVAVGVGRPAWRGAATGTAALSVLVSTAVGAGATTPAGLVVSLSAVGVAFAVGAARRQDAAEGLTLLAAGLAEAAAFAASLAAYPDRITPAAAVLAVTGVVALAYGFRRDRGWSWWLGAVLVPVAVWLVLVDAEVTTVEAFSLPLALTCLLAGVLGRARRPDLSSWAVAGPALVVGLLPSALVSADDESTARTVLVLLVGVLLLLLGVRFRWQALVVVPGVAVVVVAVSQVGPWAYGLPRWLSLGVAGAVLLAVGVRYEARRRNVVSAARWLRALR